MRGQDEELIDGETTIEGGLGTDVSDRSRGRLSDTREYDTRGLRGTGGEGGYSTLGGGVYPDEGAPEDAPGYGDWTRHSSATEEQGRRRADKGTRVSVNPTRASRVRSGTS